VHAILFLAIARGGGSKWLKTGLPLPARAEEIFAQAVALEHAGSEHRRKDQFAAAVSHGDLQLPFAGGATNRQPWR